MKIRKVRRPPEEFGDESTIDHWIARGDLSRGYNGEGVALTFRDRGSTWIDCCGMSTNNVKNTTRWLRHIVGHIDQLRYVYSDGAEELKQSAQALDAVHDDSIPENKGNNAVIERTNRHVLEGIRTLLNQPGLPMIFWPYAARYFCLACNVTAKPDEKSA